MPLVSLVLPPRVVCDLWHGSTPGGPGRRPTVPGAVVGWWTGVVATGALRAARELSSDIVGPLAANSPLWELPPVLLPGALTLFTYKDGKRDQIAVVR